MNFVFLLRANNIFEKFQNGVQAMNCREHCFYSCGTPASSAFIVAPCLAAVGAAQPLAKNHLDQPIRPAVQGQHGGSRSGQPAGLRQLQ